MPGKQADVFNFVKRTKLEKLMMAGLAKKLADAEIISGNISLTSGLTDDIKLPLLTALLSLPVTPLNIKVIEFVASVYQKHGLTNHPSVENLLDTVGKMSPAKPEFGAALLKNGFKSKTLDIAGDLLKLRIEEDKAVRGLGTILAKNGLLNGKNGQAPAAGGAAPAALTGTAGK